MTKIENQQKRVSSYLKYLPAIFHQDAEENGPPILGSFLLAFEKILSGRDDPDHPGLGLEEIIDRIHTYFDPGPGEKDSLRSPKKFLPWLASWVALSLREDWDEEQKRRFIRKVLPLYRLRGTKSGLKEMLRVYTGDIKVKIQINEDMPDPHYFEVSLEFEKIDARPARAEEIATAIIDQEKPIHTYYYLGVV